MFSDRARRPQDPDPCLCSSKRLELVSPVPWTCSRRLLCERFPRCHDRFACRCCRDPFACCPTMTRVGCCCQSRTDRSTSEIHCRSSRIRRRSNRRSASMRAVPSPTPRRSAPDSIKLAFSSCSLPFFLSYFDPHRPSEEQQPLCHHGDEPDEIRIPALFFLPAADCPKTGNCPAVAQSKNETQVVAQQDEFPFTVTVLQSVHHSCTAPRSTPLRPEPRASAD